MELIRFLRNHCFIANVYHRLRDLCTFKLLEIWEHKITLVLNFSFFCHVCRAVAYIPLTVLAVPASVLTVYT